MAGGEAQRPSDLRVRTFSALAMLLVSGGALWLGGWVWVIFVALIAAGVMWEWAALVAAFSRSAAARLGWMAGGVAYVGLAAYVLANLRAGASGAIAILTVILAVIATDIGAYFAGRSIGGPKIAPRISPSKTWAGLAGGMAGAMLALFLIFRFVDERPASLALAAIPLGAVLAVVAQAGDFFESWMKRRAGVKDSGSLIPGHGGLFDRLDGLLAVCFLIGLIVVILAGYTLATGGSLLPEPA